MDRGLAICATQARALSCASSSREKYRQSCPCRPSLQHNALNTQFLERSIRQGRNFSSNEFHDLVAQLMRSRSASVVPAVRMMGGGPRTYPGGVTKWQWKRRLRKDKWEVVKQRLSRERKLFETRRSQELNEAFLRTTPTSNGPFASGEMMTVTGQRLPSLLAPGGGPREVEPSYSVAGVETSVKAEKGIEVSGVVQEGWTASRKEVAEQILKVRDIVRNKYRRLTGPSENETTSSFGQLSLSPLSLKALNFILDIHNMTPAQEATLPIILKGVDLLARTEGGGEEIIVSLLLAIELVLSRRQELPRTGIARLQQHLTVSGRSPISVLFVCPTRDGAALVASEAKLLLMFHRAIRVQVVQGGNDLRRETKGLQRNCEIVIATPGRLLNHLEKSPELRGQLSGLKLLVLHEVQKLLDMGYRKTLERISHLVSRSRQTLLWSTSQSDEALALSQTLLKKSHRVINTCEAEEDELAYSMVRQDFLIVPIELHLVLICALVKVHVEQEPNYKVVVFCQTVRATTFMVEVFKKLGFHTCEVHMRRNEKARDRAAAEFRIAQGGVILCTCGASVWGVANPDITLILQVGPPAGQEQYVQRVSLSGQETKKRECVLLLMPHEQPFLKELATIPLWESTAPIVSPETKAQVWQAVSQVNIQIRTKAYLAWLRYHITKTTSVYGKQEVIHLANVYSIALGFQRPPQLNSGTSKALGLKQTELHPMRRKSDQH